MLFLQIYLLLILFNFSIFWPTYGSPEHDLKDLDPDTFWAVIILTPIGTCLGIFFLITFPIKYLSLFYFRWLLLVKPEAALRSMEKMIEKLDSQNQFKKAVELEKIKEMVEEELGKRSRLS